MTRLGRTPALANPAIQHPQPVSKLLVTFVPDDTVLKAIVGGLSSREEAIKAIDRIGAECDTLGCDRVLMVVKLVTSDLQPADYAEMATHAMSVFSRTRCAILVPSGRTRGEQQARQLSANFRLYFDELKALRWLKGA